MEVLIGLVGYVLGALSMRWYMRKPRRRVERGDRADAVRRYQAMKHGS